ncbi:MAG: ATP-binding cassette domain-containing protein, partial [Myxococcota bacterium]
STGTVRIGGRDPRSDDEARREVAYLPAEPELPDVLTVDEAWQQLAALRRRPGWDGVRIRSRFDLPGGIRLAQCSAGQRRLAELVAALAGDPGVLLLDEPFANLDDGRAQILAEMLQEWSEARTVIVTSHPGLPVEASVVTVGRAPDPAL